MSTIWSSDLTNKVIVITGGTSGIGLAAARNFAGQNARVVICGRRAELGARIAQETRGVTFVRADVTDESQVAALFERVRVLFGRVDLVFANAGVLRGGAGLEQCDMAALQLMFDTNVKGVILAFKHARPLLASDGVLIANSSAASIVPTGVFNAYAITKAAVDACVRGVHSELRGTNMRVFAINPCMFATELQKAADPAMVAKFAGSPNPVLGDPWQVAKLVEHLAVGRTMYRSGRSVIVDNDGSHLGLSRQMLPPHIWFRGDPPIKFDPALGFD